jgi:hypothetical protein
MISRDKREVINPDNLNSQIKAIEHALQMWDTTKSLIKDCNTFLLNFTEISNPKI